MRFDPHRKMVLQMCVFGLRAGPNRATITINHANPLMGAVSCLPICKHTFIYCLTGPDDDEGVRLFAFCCLRFCARRGHFYLLIIGPLALHYGTLVRLVLCAE